MTNTAATETTARRCYCPSDCNCREAGAPFFRINYCGCQCEDATKEFDGAAWVKVPR